MLHINPSQIAWVKRSFAADFTDEYLRVKNLCPNQAIVLIGDFNFSGIDWRKRSTLYQHDLDLLSFTESMDLKQHVNQKTRFATDGSVNVLDLVLPTKRFVNYCQVLGQFSDQSLIKFGFKLQEKVKRSKRFSSLVYDYSKTDWNALRSSVRLCDWDTLLSDLPLNKT